MRQTGIDRSGLSKAVALVTLVAGAGCLPELREGHASSSNGRSPSGDGTAGETGQSAPSSAPPDVVNGPPPELGPTVVQSAPPPPLSGGTLAVAPDGVTVVAADPDRDRVYLLDYRAPSTLQTVTLSPHDEPGRVAIDGHGRAHVILRGGAALVTIDLATAGIVARRPACAMPRGVAYDPVADVVHVACGGGELVTFPPDGGPELRRREVARDLRDVLVVRGGLLVSTFRDARVFRLDDGSDDVIERDAPTSPAFGVPRVAWRMIAGPPADGSAPDEADILLARQKAPASGDDPSVPLPPSTPDPYYQSSGPDPCQANGPGPVVEDRNEATHVPGAVLPVDLAATSRLVALVAAGNAHTPSLPQLLLIGRRSATSIASDGAFDCTPGTPIMTGGVQLTSAAFVNGGAQLVALSREPAALLTIDISTEQEIARTSLAEESREDTGHAIFHSNSGAGVACASCHPDGRDDGHAWRSLDRGARRTPSLLGTLTGTAPYHWDGEAANLDALMQLTFESRMRGPALAEDQKSAIGAWLRELPAPPRATAADAAAAARGKAVFESPGSCSSCHSGVMRTNNASVDVGTGGVFQVPSLVGAAWRTPLLHDGTAPTIRALLERGHGARPLSTAEQGDVSTYAETL